MFYVLPSTHRDGESEMIDNLLTVQPPETKLVLSLTAAAIVSSVAYFICWILGLDPFGGATLSVASLRAALVGALAAVPLVVGNFIVWADFSGSTTYLPMAFVPEEIQDAKLRTYESIIGNMSGSQVAAVLTAETFSSMLMALPAALGGLMLCFTSLSNMTGGDAVSSQFPMAAAVSVTAFMASITQAAELAVSDEEYVCFWFVLRRGGCVGGCVHLSSSFASNRSSSSASASPISIIIIIIITEPNL